MSAPKTPEQKAAARRDLLVWIVLQPLVWAVYLFLLAYVPLRMLAMRLTLAAARWRPPPHDDSDGHFDVICFSHVPWRHIWQRNHHTMTRLAQKRVVVYVENFGTSYIHIFAQRAPWSFKDLFTRHDKVHIRHPLLFPGESRLKMVRRLNRRICLTHMQWYQWRFAMRNVVLWFYYPGMVYVLEKYRPAAVVYDIQDEYSAFQWAPRDIARRERQLLDKTDVIFAGTHALYEKKTQGFERPAYFFPCAVEFEHFHKAAPRRESLPEEPAQLAGVGRPRLVYMGLIDARIDDELIAHLAQTHPEWHVVMAGPVDAGQFDMARFKAAAKNVHFLGKMDYAQLPALLAHCDLYIMPWKVNDLTRHINPTKTLEYLAAARPVVSINLPDLAAFFGDYVRLAQTREQFEAMCREALESPSREVIAKGVELARSYSWEKVVEDMENHVRQARRERAQRLPKAANKDGKR